MSFLSIHAIINIHTITSPNSITDKAPPTLIASTIKATNSNTISNKIINSIILITPFHYSGCYLREEKERA